MNPALTHLLLPHPPVDRGRRFQIELSAALTLGSIGPLYAVPVAYLVPETAGGGLPERFKSAGTESGFNCVGWAFLAVPVYLMVLGTLFCFEECFR